MRPDMRSNGTMTGRSIRAHGCGRRGLVAIACALASVLVTASSWAQDYPTRPVRIIVPFPAGGTADVMQLMAQVQFLQVPYRGSAPALQGLLAGDVDVMFDNLGVSLALVKGGQLKLIAVGTEKRMSALPDVPTIAETLPGFASAAWF